VPQQISYEIGIHTQTALYPIPALYRICSVFGSVRHDLCRPSVQKVLIDRTCKTCHLYFASLVVLRNHTTMHNQQRVQTRLVRLVRVVARWRGEMMVINANAENVEIAEWQEDRLDQTVPEKSRLFRKKILQRFQSLSILCLKAYSK